MAEANSLQEISIRKIYIDRIDPQLNEGVRHHFAQYGEIESIDFHSKGVLKYAFLQYKSASSASLALAAPEHNINGTSIKLKAAYQQPKGRKPRSKLKPQVLFSPPDQDSPMNILNKLNEHCLMEIFERLTLHDLCRVARVCTKFQFIAECIFRRKHSTDFDMMLARGKSLWDFSYFLARRLFHSFGHIFETIYLDLIEIGYGQNIPMLELIAKYCSGSNCALKDLVLYNFVIFDDLLPKMKPVFARMKRLYLVKVNVNADKLLDVCDQLTNLELERVRFGRSLRQKIGKVEEAWLIRVKGLNDDVLDQFMQSNQNLKRLHIDDPYNQFSSYVFRSIGSSLMLLEDLCIESPIFKRCGNIEQSLSHLEQLKNLKKLNMDCTSLPVHMLVGALAKGMVTIKELHLTNLKLDSQTATHLSKLATMTKLWLFKCTLESGQLLNIVKGLPVLTELIMEPGKVDTNDIKRIVEIATILSEVRFFGQQNIVINEMDFEEMATSVKNRGNGSKLTLCIRGENCQLNVPKRIIERNQNWVAVDIIKSKPTPLKSEDGSDDSDVYSDYDDSFYDDSFFDLQL